MEIILNLRLLSIMLSMLSIIDEYDNLMSRFRLSSTH